ncbi:hypothetical protein DB88DRAFT_472581 [Papiliotrema laurentii]|uniref:Uncharacterized protein n=1 Tax=Papiliotrema laurentii TaxID=5418 RepID=A0AAD9D0W1_PAPLA|nr:hypothetical protein DB88DRAFT_472581 [Papiliotrema laurentii]
MDTTSSEPCELPPLVEAESETPLAGEYARSERKKGVNRAISNTAQIMTDLCVTLIPTAATKKDLRAHLFRVYSNEGIFLGSGLVVPTPQSETATLGTFYNSLMKGYQESQAMARRLEGDYAELNWNSKGSNNPQLSDLDSQSLKVVYTCPKTGCEEEHSWGFIPYFRGPSDCSDAHKTASQKSSSEALKDVVALLARLSAEGGSDTAISNSSISVSNKFANAITELVGGRVSLQALRHLTKAGSARQTNVNAPKEVKGYPEES